LGPLAADIKSQKKLAQMPGYDRSVIAKAETGERPPPLAAAARRVLSRPDPPGRAERRARGIGPAAPPLLDPPRDQSRVGPGVPAQLRGLPHQRLVRLALGGAFEEPGHLAQQVGPPGGQLA
jgi:hypothetical protein